MKLPPLLKATLIKRYKRFLADVVLDSGETLTAHCPNTGAMTGCAEPNSTVWLSTSDNPKRKYPNTWELVQTPENHMACIHSAKANDLVKEAIESGVITELQNYDSIRTEVKYGAENSRIDLLLESDKQQCYIEVKSVTLLLDNGLGVFPDAVSERGRKHLRELIEMVQQGHRAVLFFCVQHSGIERVAPADAIDAKYGDTFREALAAGVEVLAYGAEVSVEEICLSHVLPVLHQQP
ncbi:DNA/RNA nuclease SfsA [Oceanicoccus sagamiensis]|uniref:Sugar fermentation stimulation protein homolog n=1 Tax=Oceanicoccus sagamiensis TaxID=716816 RepID=A0A1X9NHL9_9GAMM|nr:DNA/RNA nuclease SfsA [Oceanicoccus sagamiensis]ARN73483.1 sugar fermentation stimulation protein SfsA [Oceanicoccus sagamiensis]